ncbi:MAG: T9SS type A sorting domain-containing protein [Chitinophagales bacterium]|nr:T9SS type A sorting domain-containing protein [Chitinophagales bacterium]
MKHLLLVLSLISFAFFNHSSAQITAVCPTPTNVNSVVTDSNIILSWDSVPGAIGYIIQGGKVGFPYVFTIKSFSNTFIVPKAPKCLSFFYSVKAYCGSGNMSASSVKDTLTTNGCISCDTPSVLTTSNITTNSASLSWTSEDDAIFYVLQGRVVGYPKFFQVYVKDTVFNANFLAPGFTFQWRVYVVCSKTAIAGPTSWQTFTTPTMKTGESVQLSGLYPNPAQDKVQLQLLSFEEKLTEIRMSDLTGKTVMNIDEYLQPGINSVSLDLSHLQNGIYFVHYGSVTERLIINR